MGTVKNFREGLIASSGRFIKGISPGDTIIGNNTLYSWINNMVLSGKGWSFCDVINYVRDVGEQIKTVRKRCNPQDVRPYINKNDERCRWNYIMLDDIATGAAILCVKELYDEYYKYIENRVMYAEDNMFRIMAFDGEVAYYYSYNGVMYEFGDGVSTSNDNKWSVLLRKDWSATDNILINELDIFNDNQLKIKNYLKRQQNRSKYYRKVISCFDKGRVVKIIKYYCFPRLTETTDCK